MVRTRWDQELPGVVSWRYARPFQTYVTLKYKEIFQQLIILFLNFVLLVGNNLVVATFASITLRVREIGGGRREMETLKGEDTSMCYLLVLGG